MKEEVFTGYAVFVDDKCVTFHYDYESASKYIKHWESRVEGEWKMVWVKVIPTKKL